MIRLPTLLLLALSLGLCAPGPAAAQPMGYKDHYRLALEHYDAGDRAGYLEELKAMAEVMPPLGTSAADDANRPFLQYHLARAYALNGQPDEALAQLRAVLSEGVEGLMISQAEHDAAFADLRDTRPWKALTRDMAKVPITVEVIGGPLYRIEGAGCTLIASVGEDGVVLVDTGYAPAAHNVQRALRKLGGREVTTIINTHSHSDHVGGNLALGEDAVIIAHPRTREEMAAPQTFIDQTLPPWPEGALPSLTSPKPLTLYANGEEIRIIPLPGHTEGDVIVHFTHSRVIHMGDRYFPVPGKPTFPYPGEDLRAYMAAMDGLMATLGDDGAVFSGHSPPVPFLHLKLSYEALTRAVAWVQEGIDAGLSVDELREQGIPSEWDDWSKGRPDSWLTFIYGQLTAPPR